MTGHKEETKEKEEKEEEKTFLRAGGRAQRPTKGSKIGPRRPKKTG